MTEPRRRSCIVCDSPVAATATAMAVAGESFRSVASAVGVSEATIHRHITRCVGLRVADRPGATGGKRCTICAHPELDLIEERIQVDPPRITAERFGVGVNAVRRHSTAHMTGEWAEAEAAWQASRLAAVSRLVTSGPTAFAPDPIECGTMRGYARHLRKGEPTCPECRAAMAAYCRQRYGSERVLSPCGTRAAYRRHLRRGETPCTECRAAQAAYMREYNRKKASK